MSSVRQQIITGASRALFAIAWASECEEHGLQAAPPGGEIMAHMPEPTDSAREAAQVLVNRIEKDNGENVEALFARAQRADELEHGVGAPALDSSEGRRDLALFGHYLAMESLGHGVSWFDDHAKFALKLPNTFSYELDEDVVADIRARAQRPETSPSPGG